MASAPDPKKAGKATVMAFDGRATVAANGPHSTAGDQQVHLVVMAGSSVGHVFTLVRGMNAIGRDPCAPVRIEDPGISRYHALIYFDAGAEAFLIRDMDSRNGTRVNGVAVEQPRRLERGDKVEVGLGTVLRVSYGDEVETRFAKQMLDETLRDGLTGIYNRRKLELNLEHLVPAARAQGEPLSLILFDIDHFKQVNDTYGHPVGDTVLRWLCKQVATQLPANAFFARYGGEEFAVLCAAADEAAASALAESMRAQVGHSPCACEGVSLNVMTTQEIDPAALGASTLVPVTISLGVADLNGADSQDLPLVEAADRALYAAKHGGRNRVLCFSALPR